MRNGEGDGGGPQEAENPPVSDEPWWAGLGRTGGVLLVAAGIALLLWLLLTGKTAGDDWTLYYRAGKILAIGCVVAGTGLLSRRRRDAPPA
ncbi:MULTISPECIES: hypothetical protein [unclassified Streptomyces]|uniref:hypothetical protein n=1 Tax=unclassified Streptomyces TaxID=2593676 RepID=UPI002E12ACEB|nr:hypothetical protein OG452_06505 [Streptomyces sp. NBC_01197]WSS52308.1 hypothetical protein OG708_28940 [Streptomyces sp. NBC_01180]